MGNTASLGGAVWGMEMKYWLIVCTPMWGEETYQQNKFKNSLNWGFLGQIQYVMIGHLITVLAIPKIHVMTPHYLLDQMEKNFWNKILNGNKLFSFVSGCSSRTNVLPNQEDSKILQKKVESRFVFRSWFQTCDFQQVHQTH